MTLSSYWINIPYSYDSHVTYILRHACAPPIPPDLIVIGVWPYVLLVSWAWSPRIAPDCLALLWTTITSSITNPLPDHHSTTAQILPGDRPPRMAADSLFGVYTSYNQKKSNLVLALRFQTNRCKINNTADFLVSCKWKTRNTCFNHSEESSAKQT